jgi:Uncharacterized protein, possibly involved in utilization of glycolate and propanediol
MTLELAEKIAKAAHEKSKEFKRPISVSIVDESGRLVYYSRADGAGFFTSIPPGKGHGGGIIQTFYHGNHGTEGP